ncbi:MAG: response regulator [Defluviitaleaceae bacterium]|nr:response regulator [Defluviitaleaceae bacterium]
MTSKKKILIVDDTETFLYILNHILKDDYITSVAKNGDECFEAAKSQKPDLILLDVIMPGLSGYDVLKLLKSDDELKHIPVIMITGKKSDESESEGYALGAVDYITKPFIKDVVKNRIDSVMQEV